MAAPVPCGPTLCAPSIVCGRLISMGESFRAPVTTPPVATVGAPSARVHTHTHGRAAMTMMLGKARRMGKLRPQSMMLYRAMSTS